MNRRTIIKLLGSAGVAAALGGGYWLTREHNHPQLALDLTLARLTKMDPETLAKDGAWSVSRTLNHLGQSIEFSMTGYPQMKSEAFQNTAGKLAFSVFGARGRMSHGLDEPIPGEVVAEEALSPADAMQYLINTLQQFDTFEQPLKPHFAYGALSKSDYALAHVMHINNHFMEFDLA